MVGSNFVGSRWVGALGEVLGRADGELVGLPVGVVPAGWCVGATIGPGAIDAFPPGTQSRWQLEVVTERTSWLTPVSNIAEYAAS
jgi:hypothetical protein